MNVSTALMNFMRLTRENMFIVNFMTYECLCQKIINECFEIK